MHPKGDINKQIQDFAVSNDFKAQAEAIGIKSLDDVISKDFDAIRNHPAFTHTWYTQLISLLKEENLIEEFKENLR